jgi:hypothetical protein
VSPDHLQDILQICEAGTPDDRGLRELPPKTTLTLYLAKNGVGLTVPAIEAIAVRGHQVHARTMKGDLYIVTLDEIFAANIEGRAQSKSKRTAGFAAG